jgi:hypothetical protein
VEREKEKREGGRVRTREKRAQIPQDRRISKDWLRDGGLPRETVYWSDVGRPPSISFPAG